MRMASAEHVPEAAGALLATPSPMRSLGVILLAWAIGSVLLVGGVGAWVAMWRRWRAR